MHCHRIGYVLVSSFDQNTERQLHPHSRAVGVFHCAPWAEAKVGFFRVAPTLDAATGDGRGAW